MCCMNHKAYLLPKIEGTHTHTHTHTHTYTYTHSRKHRVLFFLPRQYYYLSRFSRVPLRPFSFSAPHRKIYVKRKLTGRNIPIHLVPPSSFSKQQWHINGFISLTTLGQFKFFSNTVENYCDQGNKAINTKSAKSTAHIMLITSAPHTSVSDCNVKYTMCETPELYFCFTKSRSQ
jgi:hypothetical protein